MHRRRVAQLAVGLVGLSTLPLGGQAAFAPRSFYDDFPLGRGWVAMVGGGYDEHLVRDVGGLFLAMALLSLWAWWRPALVRPVAVAWLGQGLLHLTYHLGHLQHFSSVDGAGETVALAVVPVLAVVALWADATAAGPAGSAG